MEYAQMQRLKKMQNVTKSAKYACAYLIYKLINQKFVERRAIVALKKRQKEAQERMRRVWCRYAERLFGPFQDLAD